MLSEIRLISDCTNHSSEMIRVLFLIKSQTALYQNLQ